MCTLFGKLDFRFGNIPSSHKTYFKYICDLKLQSQTESVFNVGSSALDLYLKINEDHCIQAVRARPRTVLVSTRMVMPLAATNGRVYSADPVEDQLFARAQIWGEEMSVRCPWFALEQKWMYP